jgi:hypothetical protein
VIPRFPLLWQLADDVQTARMNIQTAFQSPRLASGFAVAALLALCGCAIQEPGATAAEGATRTAAADDDKIICRRETPTSNLIPRTVCRRASEIAQSAAQSREDMESRRPPPATLDSVLRPN